MTLAVSMPILMIFTATWLSYVAGIETSYFRHWDALNVPPDTVVPMGQALKIRAGALVVAPIVNTVPAALGRLFGGLAPATEHASR